MGYTQQGGSVFDVTWWGEPPTDECGDVDWDCIPEFAEQYPSRDQAMARAKAVAGESWSGAARVREWTETTAQRVRGMDDEDFTDWYRDPKTGKYWIQVGDDEEVES